MIQKNDRKHRICVVPYALEHDYSLTPKSSKYCVMLQYCTTNIRIKYSYPILKISRTIKTFELLDTRMALFVINSTA